MNLNIQYGRPVRATQRVKALRFGTFPVLGKIQANRGSNRMTVYKLDNGWKLENGYWNEDNRSCMTVTTNADQSEWKVSGFWNHSNLGKLEIKKGHADNWEASGYWPEGSGSFKLTKSGKDYQVYGRWGKAGWAFNDLKIVDTGKSMEMNGLWDGGKAVASSITRTNTGWEVKGNRTWASAKPSMTLPRFSDNPETDKMMMLFFLLLEGHPQNEEAEDTSRQRKSW